ncbi:MAG TPA: YqgE/AlgH family protein [Segetibacter sp.]
MADIFPGKLLIADPFLRDPNFMRSVVFMCEHKDEGSFGFVLNRKYDQFLGELITGLETSNFPVFYGGPVQVDTIHFLHQCPELIPGGVEVIDRVYWGGDFEIVVQLIKTNRLTNRDIRFFIGYSGWGEGQLEEEMKLKSWITGDGTRKIIFPANVDNTWKDALKQLGGEYVQMVNYPIDPQLN